MKTVKGKERDTEPVTSIIVCCRHKPILSFTPTPVLFEKEHFLQHFYSHTTIDPLRTTHV